jgi:hypothetical protein
MATIIPLPTRLQLPAHNQAYQPMIIWPALTPAQAMVNELIKLKVTELPGLNIVSISAKVQLDKMQAMTAEQREQLLQDHIDSVPSTHPFHPNNCLHQLEVQGEEIYGHFLDLQGAARKVGLPIEKVVQAFVPSAATRERAEVPR